MIKKKIMILGFGSIGQKHYKVLNNFYKNKFEIFIYSKIFNNYFNNSSITKIKKINPDYFILCTPSNLHYKHLKLICDNFSNKTILCEKPLFIENKKFNPKANKIFVGYNLRFHPLIIKIKKLFNKKKVDKVNIYCSTNVLNWRKKRKNYSPYSLSQIRSGGVLYDLSHEIDYFTWIFGIIEHEKVIYKRNTINQKIKSKDSFYLSGKNDCCKEITISLNFASKKEVRFIEIYYKNKKYVGNLKDNFLAVKKKNQLINKIYFKNFKIIDTFKAQIKDIFLSRKSKESCNFNEAIKLTQKLAELSL